VLAEIARIAEMTPDFAGVLGDLIALLHRIALAQQLPETLAADDPDHDRIAALVAGMPPEDVQLAYQVLLTGQRDLPLAPEPRAGLEMVLLRALAFRPAPRPGTDGGGGHGSAAGGGRAATAGGGAAMAGQAVAGAGPGAKKAAAASAAPAAAAKASPTDVAEPAAHAGATAPPLAVPAAAGPGNAGDWHALIERAGVTGLADQLARNSAFGGWDGRRLRLGLDAALGHLRTGAAEQRLGAALTRVLGTTVELVIETVAKGAAGADTPARRQARADQQRRAEAEAQLEQDPVAQDLRRRFDADWVPGSIEATD
jgi:DNA polymerase-3 subunit gamma/tau